MSVCFSFPVKVLKVHIVAKWCPVQESILAACINSGCSRKIKIKIQTKNNFDFDFPVFDFILFIHCFLWLALYSATLAFASLHPRTRHGMFTAFLLTHLSCNIFSTSDQYLFLLLSSDFIHASSISSFGSPSRNFIFFFFFFFNSASKLLTPQIMQTRARATRTSRRQQKLEQQAELSDDSTNAAAPAAEEEESFVDAVTDLKSNYILDQEPKLEKLKVRISFLIMLFLSNFKLLWYYTNCEDSSLLSRICISLTYSF